MGDFWASAQHILKKEITKRGMSSANERVKAISWQAFAN
jgi:hypothetical protein